MTQPHKLWALAERVIDKAGADGLMVTTAESCTGGMAAAALTDIPGASAVFERGFVTYSNESKRELLGVPAAIIEQHGAVSAACASAMAKGALAASRADIAVSVTGVAGPTGGSDLKPVGLVWFGLADRAGVVRAERRVFTAGDRSFIRLKAAETALMLLLRAL